MIGLIAKAPRHDLAESIGPDLDLAQLLAPAGWPALSLGYGTATGGLALREAIAARHDGIGADDVVVTAGGMHALFLLAFTLCGPGTEAVVAAPVFPLARNVLQAVGAHTALWRTGFEHAYQADAGTLRTLLSPATRFVGLASPQNPSGVAVRPDRLQEIIACVAEHAPHAWLLVDETYREAVYGNDTAAASALALGPRVLSVASLSKCHGAPGLRIGWVVVRDKALREQLIAAKFHTIISCSPLDEALALQVLRQGPDIISTRRDRLAQNLQQVADWVGRHGDRIEWVRPDAGALCCVRLREPAYDDRAVQRFYTALAQHDVRVAPGAWFDDEPRVFRLGFGWPDGAALREALQAVSRALEDAL